MMFTPPSETPAATSPSAALAHPDPGQHGIAMGFWFLPFVLFALSAPLWLHVFEPVTFIYINHWSAQVATPVWTALSLLGNGWCMLGVTAPLLVLAPRLMWAWLCAAPFAILFSRSGKFLLESPRPAAVLDNEQMQIIGNALHSSSMPSGHTLTAFSVASALYFAIPPARRARHIWLFVLAAGVGLSRIAVGAHWPGDVAVGACLGLLAGLLGNVLLARMNPAHFKPTSWRLRLVALLLAFAVYFLVFTDMDFAGRNLLLRYLLALGIVITLGVFVVQNRTASSPADLGPGS